MDEVELNTVTISNMSIDNEFVGTARSHFGLRPACVHLGLLRHALDSAPPPSLISDCATASPRRDINIGHCCRDRCRDCTGGVLLHCAQF